MKQIKHYLKVDLDLEHRVFGLDLMRATAILMVVLVHGDAIIRPAFPRFPKFMIFDGVDLFFVLSGFLIGQILLKVFLKKEFNLTSVLQFWKRRWFRTLPNYYFVLALALIYTVITTGGIGRFGGDYLFFLQNFRQRHPDFFAVAWSLTIEEWFYLLLPLSLLVLHRIFPAIAKKKIMLLSIFCFLLLPMVYRWWTGSVYAAQPFNWQDYDEVFRKRVVTRLDTLMFGVFAACVKLYLPRLWSFCPKTVFALGVAGVYWSRHLDQNSIVFYVFNMPLRACGIMLMLPFCDSLKQVGKYLAIPITYVSIISYSMYLLHYTLILEPIQRYCMPINALSAISVYGLSWGLTFVLSAILYNLLEKPVTHLREKKYTITI